MDEIKIGQRYKIGETTIGTVEQYDEQNGIVMFRFNNNEVRYVVDKYSGLYPFTAGTVQRCFTQISENKDGWVKRMVNKIRNIG